MTFLSRGFLAPAENRQRHIIVILTHQERLRFERCQQVPKLYFVQRRAELACQRSETLIVIASEQDLSFGSRQHMRRGWRARPCVCDQKSPVVHAFGVQRRIVFGLCRRISNILSGFPGEAPADYEWTAQLLPRLTHLQPPSACSPVRTK
jgi:hypothetical protein